MAPQEINAKLSALAEERHAASMPSPAELEVLGVATYLHRPHSEVTAPGIVLRALKVLQIHVDRDFESYVEQSFDNYIGDLLTGAEETATTDELIPKDAAIRAIFDKFDVLADDPVNKLAIEDARLYGYYLVKHALRGEEPTNTQLRPGA